VVQMRKMFLMVRKYQEDPEDGEHVISFHFAETAEEAVQQCGYEDLILVHVIDTSRVGVKVLDNTCDPPDLAVDLLEEFDESPSDSRGEQLGLSFQTLFAQVWNAACKYEREQVAKAKKQ
jgi:hypothetical protein